MVDGLYTNYLNPRNFSQVGDFSTIVYRQQALGFNAVRLPFRCAFRCSAADGHPGALLTPEVSGVTAPMLCRFADLNIAPPKDYTRACSADSLAQIIVGLPGPSSATATLHNCQLRKALTLVPLLQGNLTNPTVPYYQINYADETFPAQVAPVQPPLDVATSGLCNAYLPQVQRRAGSHCASAGSA